MEFYNYRSQQQVETRLEGSGRGSETSWKVIPKVQGKGLN